jgi:hypothetical protein
MPAYVPPAGNAVQFNFTGIYAPPAGNAVALDFVFGSPGGGTGTDQLPAGKALQPFVLRFPEDDWQPQLLRRFAPADGYGGEQQPPHQRHAPLWQRFEEQPQLPWKRRRTFADASALYRRKRAAQIIG